MWNLTLSTESVVSGQGSSLTCPWENALRLSSSPILPPNLKTHPVFLSALQASPSIFRHSFFPTSSNTETFLHIFVSQSLFFIAFFQTPNWEQITCCHFYLLSMSAMCYFKVVLLAVLPTVQCVTFWPFYSGHKPYSRLCCVKHQPSNLEGKGSGERTKAQREEGGTKMQVMSRDWLKSVYWQGSYQSWGLRIGGE